MDEWTEGKRGRTTDGWTDGGWMGSWREGRKDRWMRTEAGKEGQVDGQTGT